MSELSPKPSVADLNDKFRRTCNPYVTPDVLRHPHRDTIVQAARDFNDFGPDNDPWGEHDYFGFDVAGDRFYGKIDYYDEAYQYHGDKESPDCNRVFTISTGSEI